MKAFITGATGFIGSYVCQELVNKGYEVHALKRVNSEIPKRLEGLPIAWVVGDLLDIHALRKGVRGCQVVYHCAGFVSLSNVEKSEMHRVNIEGTSNMVNVALEENVQKFAYISSVAALNTLNSIVEEKAEFTLQKRRDAYGISKYYGEMEVWRGVAEGLNAIIVNPSIVLADDDWSQGSGRFFQTVKNGLRYYPEGSTGFVDVKDVACCLLQLMESSIINEKFIVNAQNMSYKAFFHCIAKNMNKRPPEKVIRPWMLSALWRVCAIYAFFTGTEPLISRFSAKTASRKHAYSNDKIKMALDYVFLPITTSVQKHVRTQ